MLALVLLLLLLERVQLFLLLFQDPLIDGGLEFRVADAAFADTGEFVLGQHGAPGQDVVAALEPLRDGGLADGAVVFGAEPGAELGLGEGWVLELVETELVTLVFRYSADGMRGGRIG